MAAAPTGTWVREPLAARQSRIHPPWFSCTSTRIFLPSPASPLSSSSHGTKSTPQQGPLTFQGYRVGRNSWAEVEAVSLQLQLPGCWGLSKAKQTLPSLCTGCLQPTLPLTLPSPVMLLQGTQGSVAVSLAEAQSRGHHGSLPPAQDIGLSLSCPAQPALSSPLLRAVPGAGDNSSTASQSLGLTPTPTAPVLLAWELPLTAAGRYSRAGAALQ